MKVYCYDCQFWSSGHDACFHPNAWKKSYPFKEPGDCATLNAGHNCPWFDKEPYKEGPTGWTSNVKNGLRNFFRGLLKPWKIKVARRVGPKR